MKGDFAGLACVTAGGRMEILKLHTEERKGSVLHGLFLTAELCSVVLDTRNCFLVYVPLQTA